MRNTTDMKQHLDPLMKGNELPKMSWQSDASLSWGHRWQMTSPAELMAAQTITPSDLAIVFTVCLALR